MPNDHEKSQPTDRKRDAGDNTKPTTSQKTAAESVSTETQAKRHAENFDSLSHDTKALGHYTKAEQPLVLHDSTTGETLYDASKRHGKVLDQVSGHATDTHAQKQDAGKHLKAGERLLLMEQALLKNKSHESKDLSSVSNKIPTLEPRADHHDAASERIAKSDSDTVRGDHHSPIKQEFSAWIPDYKTVGAPGVLPKLVEVHMSPSDNREIERHYRESLHGRDESKLSDFDRTKLTNLAICDVAIDKYQTALTKSELNDTRNLPDQVRGLMLAGSALQDGAALGATKAVFHKVIEGGAIGDLASGTAMGMAFGKVVATLAANVNPWTRAAATLMRTGGVALAIKEVGEIGSHGWDGLMKSIPALDEVCKHPDEKTFAKAKESIEKHLGDPLADATLVGLGFAAAHGIEKAIPGGTKSGGKGGSHEDTGPTANHGDNARSRSHPEETSNKHDAPKDARTEPSKEGQTEAQKHKDVRHDLPRLAHSEYTCENNTEDFFRILKCGEHEERMMYMKGWFASIPKTNVACESPIKVHVLTDSAADLANVQRALIPELLRDPILLKHMGKWKGQDPKIALTGEGHSKVVAPTGEGQGAKGFTIYARSAEDALIVQRRVDAILHEQGLKLKEDMPTGNCETCPGQSKRVAICRDTFAKGRDSNGHLGPVIDEPVALNINMRYGLKPGDRLSAENLRDLEQRTGIARGVLTYSTDGRLMLKGAGGEPYHGGYYATESGVETAMGKRLERPALYALYRACGFDPCDPTIMWKRK